MSDNNEKVMKHRVIALLTREQMEFLEKLSMDSAFSTGYKLAKTDIISALVDAAIKSNLDATGIKNKEELLRLIVGEKKEPGERRRYPRLKKGLLIGFKKADSMNDYKDRLTKDVSLGGFMIEIDKLEVHYKVNEIIELTIKEGEAFKALGRITWIRENVERSGWEMGIQLVYIREEDLQRMKKNLSIVTIKD